MRILLFTSSKPLSCMEKFSKCATSMKELRNSYHGYRMHRLSTFLLCHIPIPLSYYLVFQQVNLELHYKNNKFLSGLVSPTFFKIIVHVIAYVSANKQKGLKSILKLETLLHYF